MNNESKINLSYRELPISRNACEDGNDCTKNKDNIRRSDLFNQCSHDKSPILIRKLRVGEMFSGPGGIGLALNRTKFGDFHFEHVWATDYDKDTCLTYCNNVLKNAAALCTNVEDIQALPAMIHQDVHDLDIDKLPEVDGFLYGFPCNDFSNVGESKGLDGKFGGLYTYGVKFIERTNPLFFFAENVSGIRSANNSKALKTILKALNHAGKYGYTITAHLYKFEEYGIPQARHRYIIIGIRGDLARTFDVPAPTGVMKTCEEALSNIPTNAPNHEKTTQTNRVINRLRLIPEGKNVWQATNEGAFDLFPELKLNVKGAKLSQIYRRLDRSRPSYTITGSGGGGTHVYHWSEPRALTNRERARLQTFPDDFEFVGSKESVRKQIGMAVPCDGAQIILDALLKTLADCEYQSVPPSIGTYLAKEYKE